MIIANSALRASFAIYHLISNALPTLDYNIIVNYVLERIPGTLGNSLGKMNAVEPLFRDTLGTKASVP